MCDELEPDVLDHIDTHDPKTFPGGQYPDPTGDQPDGDTIIAMLTDAMDPEATDGCVVEPDGLCPHGHPSWLIVLHLI